MKDDNKLKTNGKAKSNKVLKIFSKLAFLGLTAAQLLTFAGCSKNEQTHQDFTDERMSAVFDENISTVDQIEENYTVVEDLNQAEETPIEENYTVEEDHTQAEETPIIEVDANLAREVEARINANLMPVVQDIIEVAEKHNIDFKFNEEVLKYYRWSFGEVDLKDKKLQNLYLCATYDSLDENIPNENYSIIEVKVDLTNRMSIEELAQENATIEYNKIEYENFINRCPFRAKDQGMYKEAIAIAMETVKQNTGYDYDNAKMFQGIGRYEDNSKWGVACVLSTYFVDERGLQYVDFEINAAGFKEEDYLDEKKLEKKLIERINAGEWSYEVSGNENLASYSLEEVTSNDLILEKDQGLYKEAISIAMETIKQQNPDYDFSNANWVQGVGRSEENSTWGSACVLSLYFMNEQGAKKVDFKINSAGFKEEDYIVENLEKKLVERINAGEWSYEVLEVSTFTQNLLEEMFQQAQDENSN